MNRLILIFLLLTMVFSSGAFASNIPIDLRSSSCSILDSQSIRIRNLYASGYGYLLVDFRWDPANQFLIPIYAAYESGGGGGSTNSPPQVFNLTVPSYITVNSYFCINYQYSDSNGLGDVRTHHILMSDNTHVTFQAQGSGRFNYCSFYFASTGNHWVQVYVTDSASANSNALTGYITVSGTGGKSHCYVDSVTGDVCCDYFGSGQYVCQHRIPCGQPGGICIDGVNGNDSPDMMKKEF